MLQNLLQNISSSRVYVFQRQKYETIQILNITLSVFKSYKNISEFFFLIHHALLNLYPGYLFYSITIHTHNSNPGYLFHSITIHTHNSIFFSFIHLQKNPFNYLFLLIHYKNQSLTWII